MIKSQVHKDWSSKANGTSYLENLKITYQELVDLFGEPTIETDGYKVDAEWHVSLRKTDTGWTAPEDAFVTIYNYKDGKNYNGANGLNVEDITNWHVGGKARSHVDILEQYIEQTQPPESPELKQLKLKLHVEGTGCWTSWSGDVTGTLKFKVTEPSVGPSGTKYEGFAEGRFYLDDWNNELGMIYTDPEFMNQLQNSLTGLGFTNSSIDYSEAGMQGEDYVSMDASYELAQQAIQLGYDISIPDEKSKSKTKGEQWMDTGDFCGAAGQELVKADKLAKMTYDKCNQTLEQCIQTERSTQQILDDITDKLKKLVENM